MTVVHLSVDASIELVRSILVAHGASNSNAAVVAEHLVCCDRLGIASHGVHRVSQYVDDILSGRLRPDAVPEVQTCSPNRLHVEGRGTFGQVGGLAAAEAAAEAAAVHGMAFATVRDVTHTGRLGAYVEPLARAGNFALAFASGPPYQQLVAPFGGIEGRLSTNPICWAVPTTGEPLLADMGTTSLTEGDVRLALDNAEGLPRDSLLDAEGRMSCDPADLYTDPRGSLLPLGGERFGHKGYALGLLADVAAVLMSGDSSDDRENRRYNMALLAVRADSAVAERADATIGYMRSSAPRDPEQPVRVPGEAIRGKMCADGMVELRPAVWARLEALAADCGVAVPPATVARRPSTNR